MSTDRRYSFFDTLISQADQALRTLVPTAATASRTSPAENRKANQLNDSERRHAAGLMRINHTGEVCAQALYQGQALTAKREDIRESMQEAAREEIDHLVWCEDRLTELDSHTSRLNPLFYGLSFGIGAVAGKISDKVSLGFVAATEDQVCKHLTEHMGSLPANDERSKAILLTMLDDESRHATNARKAGGQRFPLPIRLGMTAVSKVMTKTTYRL